MVSQYPEDTVETVELRKKSFGRSTDSDECHAAVNDLRNTHFSPVWTGVGMSESFGLRQGTF